MRVALVHDWLTGMRGGEKTLEAFCEFFPEAPIYALLHKRGSVSPAIECHKIITSFIQRLPGAVSHYRNYLPLFPYAIEQFDMREYDLVLSSSHCAAKGVRKRRDAVHICYCYTPMRYAWLFFDEYFGSWSMPAKAMIRSALGRLRRWDLSRNKDVDYFIAISEHVKNRIQKFYHSASVVIYPPLDFEKFYIALKRESYYLLVSAIVPYKRIEVAIQAFNILKRPLVIIGTGSEEQRLKKMAGSHITFMGYQPDEVVRQHYAKCKAFIFPQEEDFGITALEAQASGAPVIAYRKGGALETVREGKTGLFFDEQTIESLCGAIERFEREQNHFDPLAIRESVRHFDRAVFKDKIMSFINHCVESRVTSHESR